MKPSLAIIGAGITGLSLATALAPFCRVTVFEKARGVGGRMSSRYASPYFFDHGTQFFTARSPEFQRWLQPYLDAKTIQPWHGTLRDERDTILTHWPEPHYVACPNMNSLCKALAANLTIHLNTEITPLASHHPSAWQLDDRSGKNHGAFDWVISTAPAAQSQQLLSAAIATANPLPSAEMRGCHTLMLGYDESLPLDWIAAYPNSAMINWIAVNSSKPGRDQSRSCFVVHANQDWTAENQDAEPAWIATQLAGEFTRCTGIDTQKAKYQEAHRWRYAQLVSPGTGLYLDPERRLAALGDWTAESRIEDCWLAAQAMAKKLMSYFG